MIDDTIAKDDSSDKMTPLIINSDLIMGKLLNNSENSCPIYGNLYSIIHPCLPNTAMVFAHTFS